jgi:CDP-paratose 2-epimerase
VIGYKGKQVRDAIHSRDLIQAFDAVFKAPRSGEAYNIGGGRYSNCSVLEAIALCEEICGVEMAWSYEEQNRIGDHIWWIGSNARFEDHYPDWKLTYDVRAILQEINDVSRDRWRQV